MKIKRVKDRVLGANQKHVMLSGVEGKTLMITRVEFYNLVRANELKKGEYHRDDVGLAIFKKSPQNVVLPLGEHAIGGAATPLYLANDEELILFASGSNYSDSGKKLNYIITYEEIDNA